MPKVLFIGYVWPEPNSSAAGSRMMQLLQFFYEHNYAITFASTAAASPFMANLEKLEIEIRKIQLNHPSFDKFIMDLQPEIVVFDRFMMEEQFGWRISENCPNALKILDTEDLHFLRKAREIAYKKGIPLDKTGLQSPLAIREISSMYRCDLSLIISEVEMEFLQQKFHFPKKFLFYLPFLIHPPSKEQIAQLPSFEARYQFISIGNFRHEPNWNAVLQLKEKIWPLIHEALPTAEIAIYGAYPPEKLYQLHHPKNGFLVKGWAKNANKVLQKAKVLLAPLQFGAGLKGKFIDAMSNGTPSVTTKIGAEGIHGDLDWGGVIATESQAFAQAAVKLYQQESVWKKAQDQGFQILNQRFRKRDFTTGLNKKILAIQANLTENRTENFTGKILSYHRYQSSRYLSKYLEMKNKWQSDKGKE